MWIKEIKFISVNALIATTLCHQNEKLRKKINNDIIDPIIFISFHSTFNMNLIWFLSNFSIQMLVITHTHTVCMYV